MRELLCYSYFTDEKESTERLNNRKLSLYSPQFIFHFIDKLVSSYIYVECLTSSICRADIQVPRLWSRLEFMHAFCKVFLT